MRPSDGTGRRAHKRSMAGAEGFEPPLAVLETAGLPLNLRPCIGRLPAASLETVKSTSLTAEGSY